MLLAVLVPAVKYLTWFSGFQGPTLQALAVTGTLIYGVVTGTRHLSKYQREKAAEKRADVAEKVYLDLTEAAFRAKEIIYDPEDHGDSLARLYNMHGPGSPEVLQHITYILRMVRHKITALHSFENSVTTRCMNMVELHFTNDADPCFKPLLDAIRRRKTLIVCFTEACTEIPLNLAKVQAAQLAAFGDVLADTNAPLQDLLDRLTGIARYHTQVTPRWEPSKK